MRLSLARTRQFEACAIFNENPPLCKLSYLSHKIVFIAQKYLEIRVLCTSNVSPYVHHARIDRIEFLPSSHVNRVLGFASHRDWAHCCAIDCCWVLTWCTCVCVSVNLSQTAAGDLHLLGRIYFCCVTTVTVSDLTSQCPLQCPLSSSMCNTK